MWQSESLVTALFMGPLTPGAPVQSTVYIYSLEWGTKKGPAADFSQGSLANYSSHVWVLLPLWGNDSWESKAERKSLKNKKDIHLKCLDFLPPGLKKEIEAESLQQLGGFNKSRQMFPAVSARGITVLCHSLVEGEHGECPWGLWFSQQILSCLLQEPLIAARPDLRTQLTVTAHIVLIQLLSGNLGLFLWSAAVLHDCHTDKLQARMRKYSCQTTWGGSESKSSFTTTSFLSPSFKAYCLFCFVLF